MVGSKANFSKELVVILHIVRELQQVSVGFEFTSKKMIPLQHFIPRWQNNVCVDSFTIQMLVGQ